MDNNSTNIYDPKPGDLVTFVKRINNKNVGLFTKVCEQTGLAVILWNGTGKLEKHSLYILKKAT